MKLPEEQAKQGMGFGYGVRSALAQVIRRNFNFSDADKRTRILQMSDL